MVLYDLWGCGARDWFFCDQLISYQVNKLYALEIMLYSCSLETKMAIYRLIKVIYLINVEFMYDWF